MHFNIDAIILIPTWKEQFCWNI